MWILSQMWLTKFDFELFSLNMIECKVESEVLHIFINVLQTS